MRVNAFGLLTSDTIPTSDQRQWLHKLLIICSKET
jgi:hypothetical protein